MRAVVRMLLLALCLCAGTAPASEQVLHYGRLQVTAWTPDSGSRRALPVLLFSHGFHGCDVQSRSLLRGLAASGYLVFAPNHQDASCDGGRASWMDAAQQPFWRPDHWTDATYSDRAADMRALLAALHADPRFAARADWSRLGLIGHSLGGYTALGLAGAWPRWRLPGVRAVLALAPYSLPFSAAGTLARLPVPVMYQCGAYDFAITPLVGGRQGGYAASPPPKYYVEFAGAGHVAWTDMDNTAHSLILAYALAFLDHYVKGAPAAAELTSAEPGVAQLEFDSELGRGALAGAQSTSGTP